MYLEFPDYLSLFGNQNSNKCSFTSDLFAGFLLEHHDNCTIIAKSKTNCIIKFLTHRTPPNHKTFLKLSKSRYGSFREERVYLLLVTFLSQGRNEIPLQISPCPPSGILFSGIFICFPWLGIGFHSTCFLTGASARNPRDIWQKAVFCPKKNQSKFQPARTLTKRGLLLPKKWYWKQAKFKVLPTSIQGQN